MAHIITKYDNQLSAASLIAAIKDCETAIFTSYCKLFYGDKWFDLSRFPKKLRRGILLTYPLSFAFWMVFFAASSVLFLFSAVLTKFLLFVGLYPILIGVKLLRGAAYYWNDIPSDSDTKD